MTHFSGLLGLRLLPMLREQEPDLILSTHPFATEMISHLKEKGLVQAPLICLMTDYGPHRAWIAPRVDAYVVSNEDMLPEMVEMGAPRDIIYPFGIPVDNVFFSKENKAALLQEMGLEPGRAHHLIHGGQLWGVGYYGYLPGDRGAGHCVSDHCDHGQKSKAL